MAMNKVRRETDESVRKIYNMQRKKRAAFKSRKQNQPLKPKKNFCDVKREISSIPSEISNSVTKKTS